VTIARRAWLALGLFVVGSGAIVAFDTPRPRAIGVAMLVAAIVIGATALLTPATLGAEAGGPPDPPPPVGTQSPGSPLP
jgi:hypothetical protein